MDTDTIYAMSIQELDLSVRTTLRLEQAEIFTVRDLVDKIKTPNDMPHIRLTAKQTDEICSKLEFFGISLFAENYISEQLFNERINLPIDELCSSTATIQILKNSGILTVSDLMYELVDQADITRIGLNTNDITEISSAIRSAGLRLGIFDEPISALGSNGEIISKLELSFNGIQDILKTGFSGLLDELLLSPEDAVKTAKLLQRSGYLLVGYPGLDNPATCKKLRGYFLSQPLSYIGVSENVERRMTLAKGNTVTLNFFVRTPVKMWYSIIQDYHACVDISEKLNKLQIQFRPSQQVKDLQLDEESFLKKITNLYSPLEDLNISKQLYCTLVKKGITSVRQLVSFSATELSEQKIAGEHALSSIRNALYSGQLLLKNDYLVKCECCGNYIISNDTTQTICSDCIAKHKRVKKISKVDITISGPDFGSYTNLSSGFTLYANIKNTTSDLLKVRLHDFYVVEEDKQISYKYYLTGYSFEEENIMPGTVKSAGKIWDTSRFQYSTSLDSDAYIIVSIQLSSESYRRMYKFIQNDNDWVIDDFFTV